MVSSYSFLEGDIDDNIEGGGGSGIENGIIKGTEG